MYENYEFPHVHTYEGDLGWLIHAYKKLLKDYHDLLDKVTQMEDDYNNINPTIDAAIARMEAELAKAIAEMEAIVAGLENMVNQAIADMRAEVKAELDKYFTLIIQMEQQLSSFQVWIKRYTDTQIISVKEWCLAKIREMVLQSQSWNPVYGKVDTARNSMEDVYNFDSFAIPAAWLAAMDVPVQDLIDMHITAAEWDTKARWYLLWWWITNHKSILKMSNPWTGEMDDPRHVLVTLIGMHQEGVTAQELADANITVDAIADSETTAYDHDWKRGWFDALLPKPDPQPEPQPEARKVTRKTTRKGGN